MAFGPNSRIRTPSGSTSQRDVAQELARLAQQQQPSIFKTSTERGELLVIEANGQRFELPLAREETVSNTTARFK